MSSTSLCLQNTDHALQISPYESFFSLSPITVVSSQTLAERRGSISAYGRFNGTRRNGGSEMPGSGTCKDRIGEGRRGEDTSTGCEGHDAEAGPRRDDLSMCTRRAPVHVWLFRVMWVARLQFPTIHLSTLPSTAMTDHRPTAKTMDDSTSNSLRSLPRNLPHGQAALVHRSHDRVREST